jgi:dihydroxyacetone kinase
MKKFINQPELVVEDMIQGLLLTHAGLARLAGYNVLLRSDIEQVRDRQVALVSGGGSGHEPAHAGYVGAGMLSAAVAGEVFTSPSTNSVFAAVTAVAGTPGVLLIVKNYTGDRLNFGLAAEMARAEGINTETVVVADDIALADSEENAGRRGLAGTVFVHKIAGAAAQQGKSLAEVAAIARATARDVATMGVSLSAGTIPAVGRPNFTLGESEMELGLGIHGEPGLRRMPLEQANELADRIVATIGSAHQLRAGEHVAVLINNLGATTSMELDIFAGGALRALASRQILIDRVYTGTFLSSLDTAGVSLSVLRVDESRLSLLDEPTSAPAWPNVSAKTPGSLESRIFASAWTKATMTRQPPRSQWGTMMQEATAAVCRALVEAEARLTELDRLVGDGDLGTGLKRGANAIEAALATYPLDDAADTLKAIALTVQETIGGSSGPLYAILLLRAAHSLEGADVEDPTSWASALIHGCEGVSSLGGARAGDRTMLDALLPFAHSLGESLQQGSSMRVALAAAADKAEAAAEATAEMLPRRGRSSYLGTRALGTPDPGAIAAAIWLRALVALPWKAE